MSDSTRTNDSKSAKRISLVHGASRIPGIGTTISFASRNTLVAEHGTGSSRVCTLRNTVEVRHPVQYVKRWYHAALRQV